MGKVYLSFNLYSLSILAGGTGTFGTGTGASAFGSTQAQQQPAATTNLFGNPQPAANTQTSAFGAFGKQSNVFFLFLFTHA